MGKTLVTGADGLLGGNLVRALLDRGAEVRALVHPSSRSASLHGLEVERVEGDILEPGSVARAAAGCDKVFHCAASTALWPPRDPMITAVNLDGTRNLIEAAVAAGASSLVHVGSASSFGFGTRSRPGTEESPYAYSGYGLAYFDSKRSAQELVVDEAARGRIRAVVVNPTFMIGPHDYGPSSGELIVRYASLGLPAYPPGGRNFVHVAAVARGMLAAMEQGRTGERYLLGGENLTMKEFFTLVAETMGLERPWIRIPGPAIMLAGRIGSLAGRLGAKPLISLETARNACAGTYYSSAKAERELGLTRTRVRTAVEDACAWLDANGYFNPKNLGTRRR